MSITPLNKYIHKLEGLYLSLEIESKCDSTFLCPKRVELFPTLRKAFAKGASGEDQKQRRKEEEEEEEGRWKQSQFSFFLSF